jgi:ubiquitin-conjugating enzyme E2 D
MGTPYEGGVFFIRVDIPKDYPLYPPICRFITPVYHPNIDREGKMVVSILEPYEAGDDIDTASKWNAVWTLSTSKSNKRHQPAGLRFSFIVLIGICSLLDDPNWLQPLMPEIARQYGEDPVAFEAQARIFTQRYAQGKIPSASEFAAAHPANFWGSSGSLHQVREQFQLETAQPLQRETAQPLQQETTQPRLRFSSANILYCIVVGFIAIGLLVRLWLQLCKSNLLKTM